METGTVTALQLALLLLGGLGFVLLWSLRKKPEKVFSRLGSRSRVTRILYEDALKHIYKCEANRQEPTVQSLGGQLSVNVDVAASIVTALETRTLLKFEEDRIRLTPQGREYALHVIRAHRLWEVFLADETGVSQVDWHGKAEVEEHKLSPAEADLLAAQLGHPVYDPHGDPIPTAEGEGRAPDGNSLLSLEAGGKGRIVHVEDEPESVFAQLVSLGIHPGMEFQIIERSAEELVVLLEGNEVRLTPLAAANVTVRPVEEQETDFSAASRLSELQVGEKGTVVIISRVARGIERRRFMDLGILPGTQIQAEFAGPGGDPTAYRIRGALIALRKEQADQIFVSLDQRDAA